MTGGSTGIGLAVCLALAERGASVTAVARNAQRLEAAVAGLPGEHHVSLPFDVGDAAAWPDALEGSPPIDLLVTAAAVLDPIGPAESIDPTVFLDAIRINLLGTFLAFHHLLPGLVAAKGAAVTFSGGGGTSPLPRYDAYAASKAAVVRLTENLAVAEPKVRINAVAPGFVATDIHEATLAAGSELAGSEYLERTRRGLEGGGLPAGEAAELVCELLGPRAAGVSGRLVSAEWDHWRDDAFFSELRSDSSLGTLRRIDGQLFAAVTDK